MLAATAIYRCPMSASATYSLSMAICKAHSNVSMMASRSDSGWCKRSATMFTLNATYPFPMSRRRCAA